MRETTITVDVDEHGRVTIPKPARKKLGIDGDDADMETPVQAELTVKVDA